ncbi:E3 ubiquitin-protein ligase rnf146-like [Gigantopelta aegis]|uniref:E3 ubiquitin-protein ligase rnf146-like n=1 Tax=Gigantopelta aegis TaxID=1735272 RepID=UPI001B88A138|nr:E3 ubiquitin-protein ligase rnf146-like [Gigantopelta aegis]
MEPSDKGSAKPNSVVPKLKLNEEDESDRKDDDHKLSKTRDDETVQPDCPVCLQAAIYPVVLPCKHIFCFLCVKGVANRNKKCALCRQEIPADYFRHPNLMRKEDLHESLTFDNGFQWFYEGVNGWWQYDDRTSIDLETHYKKGDKAFEMLIAGFLYIIDLDNMVQCRRNDRTKKRKIKRDLSNNIPTKKGIAGLSLRNRNAEPHSDRPVADGDEVDRSASIGNQQIMVPIPFTQQVDRDGGYTNSLSPPTPYNTPQTPQTPAESPPNSAAVEQELSANLDQLRLGDGNHNSVTPPEYLSQDDTAASSPRSANNNNSSSQTRQLEDVRASLQEIESNIYDQMDDGIASAEQDSADEECVVV